VAYYPFNGNANDVSGNLFDGTVNGATLTLDRFGHDGKAFLFTGTNDIRVYGFTNYSFPSNVTFSAWVSPSSFDGSGLDRGVVSKPRSPTGGGIRIGVTMTNAEFALIMSSGGPVNLAEVESERANVWIHIVGCLDTNQMSLYVNGILKANRAPTPFFQGAEPLYIGTEGISGQGDRAFRGMIDDVRIYNRALSSNEVAQLYAFEADMPVITAQPQGQTVAQGGTATFSVTATAANPLTCQWFKDGVALTSATNTTLTLTNVQPNQIGYYSVAVSNAVTGVVSANAVLNVSGYDFSQWQGLVAYYPFNGNANDACGNGNNGTNYGATLATDRFGQSSEAYSFAGVSDYIAAPNPTPDATNKLTMSLWLKARSWTNIPTSTPYVDIAGNQQSSPQSQWVYQATQSGQIRWAVITSTGNHAYNSIAQLQTNRWYHVVGTWDGTNASIFVNGAFDSSAGALGSLAQCTLPLQIGGNSLDAQQFFNGLVDDVRIYNRALSPSEVEQLYASELQAGMRLGAQVATNGVYLSFPAAANLAYSVLFRTNLAAGLWEKLADVPAQPTNSTAQLTDPAVTNSPQRFYRVVTPSWP
jgi:hypothetical protein